MIINASSLTDSHSALTVNVWTDFYDSTVYSYAHSGVIDINCDKTNGIFNAEVEE